MDVKNDFPRAKGEVNMVEKEKKEGDLIIIIPENEQDSRKDQKLQHSSDLHHDSTCASSPDSVRSGPSPNKPPKIIKSGTGTDTLSRRQSLSRSVLSKPKSRFGEQSVIVHDKIFEEDHGLFQKEPVIPIPGSPVTKLDGCGASSIKQTIRTVSITPKTPLFSSSPGGFEGVDEDEEIYKKVSSRKKMRYRKVKTKVLMEWFLFLCVLGCLVAGLTIEKFERWKLWELEIWKWCVLVLVIFSGLLVTKWLMRLIVLLVELNYMLKTKVLYFVYGMRKSVQVCIWLSIVLITWILLFQKGVERSRVTVQVLNFVTWTIVSLLIGSFLWLLKTLLLKTLASSFHVNTFFDRIQESMFHQYILFTLSGPPAMESEQNLGRTNNQFSFRVEKKGKEGKGKTEKELIDITKLHQLKQGKVSAWTMNMLVDAVSNSRLATLSTTIDEREYEACTDKEITNEEEAIAAAYHIFCNVAQTGYKYIDEMDLRRFMVKEDVEIVLAMINASEAGKIDKKVLTNWVLKVYEGRKALVHALNDTKTAVKQLSKLVSAVLMIIIAVVWLLLTGIATTKVLVFLSSQLVLAAFMFGNTCKTIFEAIIFVFVMHPFDVGDRCVIDGVQMIVEEMNILTTVFLKFDNEKIYYPNSVLSTKPISNFYRSPHMSDSLEFCIDFKTPMEKIAALKGRIEKYLEKNSQFWYSNHSVVVKEIENVNKIKMALYFNHTMNFQDFPERNRRRTQLVLEMKRMLEELMIRYDLLPQQVHLVDPNTLETARGIP